MARELNTFVALLLGLSWSTLKALETLVDGVPDKRIGYWKPTVVWCDLLDSIHCYFAKIRVICVWKMFDLSWSSVWLKVCGLKRGRMRGGGVIYVLRRGKKAWLAWRSILDRSRFSGSLTSSVSSRNRKNDAHRNTCGLSGWLKPHLLFVIIHK